MVPADEHFFGEEEGPLEEDFDEVGGIEVVVEALFIVGSVSRLNSCDYHALALTEGVLQQLAEELV